MMRSFTCIVCPNGCDIEAQLEEGRIVSIEGALCPKGRAYVEQELLDPRRTIASSVSVAGGVLPLVSVRLTNAVPKNRIFDVMREIRKVKVTAPVCVGDRVIENVLGLGADVIVTKNVDAVESR